MRRRQMRNRDPIAALRAECPTGKDLHDFILELILLAPERQKCPLLMYQLVLAYAGTTDVLQQAARAYLTNHPWRPGTFEARWQRLQDSRDGAARF